MPPTNQKRVRIRHFIPNTTLRELSYIHHVNTVKISIKKHSFRVNRENNISVKHPDFKPLWSKSMKRKVRANTIDWMRQYLSKEHEGWRRYDSNACLEFSLWFQLKNHSLPWMSSAKIVLTGIMFLLFCHHCKISAVSPTSTQFDISWISSEAQRFAESFAPALSVATEKNKPEMKSEWRKKRRPTSEEDSCVLICVLTFHSRSSYHGSNSFSATWNL